RSFERFQGFKRCEWFTEGSGGSSGSGCCATANPWNLPRTSRTSSTARTTRTTPTASRHTHRVLRQSEKRSRRAPLLLPSLLERAPLSLERGGLQAPVRVELLSRFLDPAEAAQRAAKRVARLRQI